MNPLNPNQISLAGQTSTDQDSARQDSSRVNLLDDLDKKLLHKKLVQRLMSARQKAYCLKLREKINPDLKDFALVYCASGPDIMVPLLTTDTNKLLCFDRLDFDLNIFQSILEKGNSKLYSTREIPLDLNRSYGHSPDRPQEYLDFALNHKRRYGYWLIHDIQTIGLERCLAIELDNLGVNFNKVETDLDEKGNPRIAFSWGLDQAHTKTRQVTFQQGLLPDDLDLIDFPNYSGFLQKSSMDAQAQNRFSEQLKKILVQVAFGFKIIAGKPLNGRPASIKSVADYFSEESWKSQLDDILQEDRGVDFRRLNSYGQQLLIAMKN